MSYALNRAENLLGALVVALGDDQTAAVEAAAGQGGGAPAAMIQLAAHPGLSVDGLRRRLNLTHSAVVRLVDRLAHRGLVSRSAGTADARVTVLNLTAAGTTTAAAIQKARADVLHEALAKIPAAELAEIERSLARLLRDLTRSAGHSSQICRLCQLDACPAQDCPVEQRCLEYEENEPSCDRDSLDSGKPSLHRR